MEHICFSYILHMFNISEKIGIQEGSPSAIYRLPTQPMISLGSRFFTVNPACSRTVRDFMTHLEILNNGNTHEDQ